MIKHFIIFLAIMVGVGCGPAAPSSPTATPPPPATPVTPSITTDASTGLPPTITTQGVVEHSAVGLTYQSVDGNRYVEGQIDLPEAALVDIELRDRPLWVVGVAVDAETALWAAALPDGTVQGFRVGADGAVETVELGRLPAGTPPVLEGEQLVMFDEASPLTSPLPLGEGLYAYITEEGVLVMTDGQRLDINALPDARLVTDGTGSIAVLTQPTDAYGHGVLGDDIEAGRVTVVETTPTLQVVAEFGLEGWVIEGLAPIWADLTGDGQREIIVTVANASNGAKIVAFDDDGTLVAEGPAIGQGFRWRHQLAVAPFSDSGVPPVLVEVLTPHLGRVTGFYALEGADLSLVNQVSGYTSHVIGSRNLDMALAAHLDADEDIELLLPSADMRVLGAISYGGAIEWEVDLPAPVTSNLHGVRLDDGGLMVGVGLENNTLRIWYP